MVSFHARRFARLLTAILTSRHEVRPVGIIARIKRRRQLKHMRRILESVTDARVPEELILQVLRERRRRELAELLLKATEGKAYQERLEDARKAVEETFGLSTQPKRSTPNRPVRAITLLSLILPEKRRHEVVGDFLEAIHTANELGYGRWAIRCLFVAKLLIYTWASLKLRIGDMTHDATNEAEIK